MKAVDTMSSLFLVIYDREIGKRLSGYHYNKIRRILQKHGGYRLQYSVYITHSRECAEELASVIKDGVRIYRVIEEL